MSNFPAGLTPEQLALTPAAAPPPGVVPNLIDPPSIGHVMIIVGSVLMFAMLIFAALRFYTKIFITRKSSWDDCMLPGAVP